MQLDFVDFYTQEYQEPIVPLAELPKDIPALPELTLKGARRIVGDSLPLIVYD